MFEIFDEYFDVNPNLRLTRTCTSNSNLLGNYGTVFSADHVCDEVKKKKKNECIS